MEIEVLSITIDNIGVLRSYYPVSGWAKWFEDELGQLWCRFSIAGPEGQTLQKVVIPARWVMEVRYRTQDSVSV